MRQSCRSYAASLTSRARVCIRRSCLCTCWQLQRARHELADLLLTHGYFLYEDPKELQIMKPYVPLGILYICSHLRKHGFQVEVFDSTFSSREDLFTRLRESAPSVLGIYANLMTRRNVIEI